MYPLPIIDDLLDQLNNVVYFTMLDLKSGYNHIRITKNDVKKNGFQDQVGVIRMAIAN